MGGRLYASQSLTVILLFLSQLHFCAPGRLPPDRRPDKVENVICEPSRKHRQCPRSKQEGPIIYRVSKEY